MKIVIIRANKRVPDAGIDEEFGGVFRLESDLLCKFCCRWNTRKRSTRRRVNGRVTYMLN